MKQYRFDHKINQIVVDGILQGYKNFLEELREKQETMKISSAYAWVRGNHIDDQTATLCENVGIQYLYARAGYSWGYLQFTNEEERKMFIVKNGQYLDQTNVSKRKGISTNSSSIQLNKNNYLYKLAQINHNVDLRRSIQLQLPLDGEIVVYENDTLIDIVDDDLQELQDKYDYFYIITYEVDRSGMISRIQSLLPSPIDGRAYEIEDLTKYIETSDVDLTNIDTSIVYQGQEKLPAEYPEAIQYDITTYDDHAKSESGD